MALRVAPSHEITLIFFTFFCPFFFLPSFNLPFFPYFFSLSAFFCHLLLISTFFHLSIFPHHSFLLFFLLILFFLYCSYILSQKKCTCTTLDEYISVTFTEVTNLSFSSVHVGGTAGLCVLFQRKVQDTQQAADYTFHYTNIHWAQWRAGREPKQYTSCSVEVT